MKETYIVDFRLFFLILSGEHKVFTRFVTDQGRNVMFMFCYDFASFENVTGSYYILFFGQ